MTHSRKCLKCERIIPWTLDPPKKVVLRTGAVLYPRRARLICPEHGEFRNPAEKLALKNWRSEK